MATPPLRKDTMSDRLRLVVFTAGPLSAINRALFTRLAGDPLLDLQAIIVDERVRRPRPLLARIARGLREDGWPWLWFKALTTTQALGARVARALFVTVHGSAATESYETLAGATGVVVRRVADVNSDASVSLIRALRPQLGVIVQAPIPGEAVTSIPERGTVNIHRRKLPEYRGSGPVGYWEAMAGESSIGVTVHYAGAPLDPGDVLDETTIPIEECDTLASLRLKADLVGAQLCHEAIRKVVRGEARGVPQAGRHAHTYRAPTAYRVWRLERELRRRARGRMPLLRAQPGPLVRARVTLQYLLLSPLLLAIRRRLRRQRRSPVCVLFYHLVANRPLNHMCLPLEEFVRQTEFLRRYYRLLPLEEVPSRLEDRTGDEVAVAITFDDGYRDNKWAIEYMRYVGVRGAFFVSIGHVLDGSLFEHDVRRGFKEALPMEPADLQRLTAEGFLVGSHGVHHEDLGALDATATERVLAESCRLLGETLGAPPDSFSFPRGHWGGNITAATFAAAARHYRHVYSADAGYNFPGDRSRYLFRLCSPTNVLELAAMLDGYTGFRQCLTGNAWGLKTAALTPSMTPQH